MISPEEKLKINVKIVFPYGLTSSNDTSLAMGPTATQEYSEYDEGLYKMLKSGFFNKLYGVNVIARNPEIQAHSKINDIIKDTLRNIKLKQTQEEKKYATKNLDVEKDEFYFKKLKKLNEVRGKNILAKLPNQIRYKEIKDYDIAEETDYSFLSAEIRKSIFFPTIEVKVYDEIKKEEDLLSKYKEDFIQLGLKYLFLVKETILQGTALPPNTEATLREKREQGFDTRPLIRTGKMINSMQCAIYINNKLFEVV